MKDSAKYVTKVYFKGVLRFTIEHSPHWNDTPKETFNMLCLKFLSMDNYSLVLCRVNTLHDPILERP